jgi:protein-S-isoprenylcysteine O-methyltransferase Ste14
MMKNNFFFLLGLFLAGLAIRNIYELWILGWSLYHGAAFSVIPGLLGIGSILYWRRLEEHDLESRYGDDYRHYRARSWF